MKGVAGVETANLHPVSHRLVFVAVANCSRLSTLRGESAIFFAVLQLSIPNTNNDAMLSGGTNSLIESR